MTAMPQFTIRVGFVSPEPNLVPITINAKTNGDVQVLEGVASTKPNLAVSLLKVNPNDLETFNSYREFLNRTFDTMTYDVGGKIEDGSVTDEEAEEIYQDHLCGLISKHCNLIAARTRRGAGNVIEVPHNSILNVNRFRAFYPHYIVLENDQLLDNEVFVYYEGRRDDPTILDGGFWIKKESDKIVALTLKNTERTLGNASDYGIILNIA